MYLQLIHKLKNMFTSTKLLLKEYVRNKFKYLSEIAVYELISSMLKVNKLMPKLIQT